MKQLTKDIRKDVKTLIEKVGGTVNITNTDITSLIDKYHDVTAVTNQIDYFKYSRGL